MSSPASPVTTEKPSAYQDLARGARACLPVCISVAAYGLVWGVLAGQAGLSVLEVLLMSGLVFAGSSQFVALDLWTGNPAALPIGALVLAVAIVNLRYVLLTATLRPLFASRLRPSALAAIFVATDENWALTVAEMRRRPTGAAFLVGGGLMIYVSWLASTAIGRLLGAAIDDPAAFGLDFAFTATFLALLLGMWRGKGDLVPWLVGAGAALIAARLIEGNWYILVGGLIGSFAGAVFETRARRDRLA
ncbi:AzlC family ABC transporter permease [Devosia nitrariae]|uniref:Branched-chain amino acid ABC transporter permease n=1 Tax=Devosia nitrariae TaxID=2071872 RepID=A0ABQ5W2F9_9HYPH|nr:AzlC family ABC transporter permease [Devosia nitrariae]GLQ54177.1 branched-chain amino acid ABC transporter permease [Devosia nitrariae]